MSYAKNWIFTEHDVSKDIDSWSQNGDVKFIQWQKEMADTGKEHYQGMIMLEKKYKLARLKKDFSPTAHWEVMRNLTNSLKYTSKEKTRLEGPWKYGEVPETTMGSRSDIHDLKRRLEEGESMDSIQDSDPIYFEHRYQQMARSMQVALAKKKRLAQLEERYASCPLRGWQQEALDLLAVQCDRKILWIADFEGETGKSFLTQWLLTFQQYQVLGPGKYQDLVYNVDVCAKGYVFDLPASVKEEYLPYSLMEKLKDGILVSTKYEGGAKYTESTKVIVFANIGPDPAKFKKNRLAVYSPVKNLLTGETSLKLLTGFE